MTDPAKLTLRVTAIVMGAAAIFWGAEIVRQASQPDDGGPPLGAMCMAVPSIVLLTGAGAIWSSTMRGKEKRSFDVIQKSDGATSSPSDSEL